MTDQEAASILKEYNDFIQGRGPYRFDPRSRCVPPSFRDVYSMRDLYSALDYAVGRFSVGGSCDQTPKRNSK